MRALRYQKTRDRSLAQDRAWKKYRRMRNAAEMMRRGGACEACGFDDMRALQWDHVTPAEKERNVTHCWSDVRFYREVARCRLLCANCHQIHTLYEPLSTYVQLGDEVNLERDLERQLATGLGGAGERGNLNVLNEMGTGHNHVQRLER